MSITEERSGKGFSILRAARNPALGVGICALFALLGGGLGSAEAQEKAHEKRSPGRPVAIDFLPEDRDNVVDPLHGDRVPVAILGSATLDVHALDPESLRLDGAAPTKDRDGNLAGFKDVDGDGRTDLVVQFAERSLPVSYHPFTVRLTGTTLGGDRIHGADMVRTIQSLRMGPQQSAHVSGQDKLPPIPIEIQVLPGVSPKAIDLRARTVPVAILSRGGFDAASVDPASVSLAGAPVTRPIRGTFSELRDVDGDGREDRVVEVASEALRLKAGSQEVVLEGMTLEGRRVIGSGRVASIGTSPKPESAKPLSASGPTLDSASSGAITLSDNAPASPFPSTIAVTAPTSSLVGKVRVTLKGLSHTYTGDLDILLVGPEGQSVVLMSDAGQGTVSGVDLTFDDDAPEYLPQVSPAATGTYRPTNYFDGPDVLPAPAPPPSASPGLSAFNSTHPNGTWSLYVLDDQGADVGVIAEGWSIEILTMSALCYSPDAPAQLIPDNQAYTIYPIPTTGSASGVVSKVGFRMFFAHPSPEDLDILVVSPSGQKAVVLSDAGGSAPLNNVVVRLDDDAADRVPEASLPTGAFQPFNYDDGIPDSFPAPAPPGPYATSLDALRGSRGDGNWQIFMVDDAPTGGQMGFLVQVCLGVIYELPSANSNTTPITIPQGAPAMTIGTAAPYPSEIRIAGMEGVVGKVTVELHGLSHTFPGDLDLLLVSPSGQTSVLMSDAGGNMAATNLDLTFDDDAALPVPAISAGFVSGTFRPANYFEDESYPAPAPPGTHTVGLAAFNNSDPNGIWRLYVVDDAGGDVGSIASWKLNISTVHPPAVACNRGALLIPGNAPPATAGPASPYPSTVSLGGLDFPAGRVKLTLSGFSHTFPGDVDVMLVSPQGQNLLVMSDAGAGFTASNLNLSFEDMAAAPPPESAPLTSGSFRPINYDGMFSDAFPPPAPAPSAAVSFMEAFGGADPNGTWKLFIQDDNDQDVGNLTGWCLEVAPLLPTSQVATTLWDLRWLNGSDLTMGFNDDDINVVEYNLYRGTGSELPALLNPAADSCRRSTQADYTFEGLTEVPPVGAFYWYVARGANAGGDEGSAGFARTNLGAESRVQDSSGVCP